MVKRFECAEHGCGTVVEAEGDNALLDKVQQHLAEAHDSFELEEVILANATEVRSKQAISSEP